MVKIDDLSKAVDEQLTVFSTDITDQLKFRAKNNMDDLVKKTKATAPVGKRRKHYKSSIASKKKWETKRGAMWVWYVKGSDYRLSHLLNNGHALRDGGRYRGTKFITKAHDEVVANFETDVDEIIKKWNKAHG